MSGGLPHPHHHPLTTTPPVFISLALWLHESGSSCSFLRLPPPFVITGSHSPSTPQSLLFQHLVPPLGAPYAALPIISTYLPHLSNLPHQQFSCSTSHSSHSPSFLGRSSPSPRTPPISLFPFLNLRSARPVKSDHQPACPPKRIPALG